MFSDVLRYSMMFYDGAWCFMMLVDVLWCSMKFFAVLRCSIRVDIWRDRCDRRSCKILASRVNLSENNAKCTAILPQHKARVLDLITIDAWHLGMWVVFCCFLTYCVMFAQSLHKIGNNWVNYYTFCVISVQNLPNNYTKYVIA